MRDHKRVSPPAAGEVPTISLTSVSDLNRRFAELCGIRAIKINCNLDNTFTRKYPDFISDPRLVIREMVKRSDWAKFIMAVGTVQEVGIGRMQYYVDIKYILVPGLLAKAAIEWLEKEEKRCRQQMYG
jgi:hypothetical protein